LSGGDRIDLISAVVGRGFFAPAITQQQDLELLDQGDVLDEILHHSRNAVGHARGGGALQLVVN
jgi:hypothetical protein